MTTTGYHIRERLRAAIVAVAGVNPDPGHRLQDVITVLVYQDRAGETVVEIGPREGLSLAEVRAILKAAAKNIGEER